MRIYDTYRLSSFDCKIEHDFKAQNHHEAIEKCKEYDMPDRSMLHYIKDSGKLKGVTFICWINQGGVKMESKWYVVVDTQADGKDYVGINDDSYCGDNIISVHDSEDEADQACIKYAQEQGLPLFADYREASI